MQRFITDLIESQIDRLNPTLFDNFQDYELREYIIHVLKEEGLISVDNLTDDEFCYVFGEMTMSQFAQFIEDYVAKLQHVLYFD